MRVSPFQGSEIRGRITQGGARALALPWADGLRAVGPGRQGAKGGGRRSRGGLEAEFMTGLTIRSYGKTIHYEAAG
jgi:hypothetical protein